MIFRKGLFLTLLGSLCWREVEDSYVSELHACTMSEEADVAGLIEHAWMVLSVHCEWIVVRSVWSYIVTLACLLDVAVDNHLTIYGNGDVVALYADFLSAPFAERLVYEALCRDDAVY